MSTTPTRASLGVLAARGVNVNAQAPTPPAISHPNLVTSPRTPTDPLTSLTERFRPPSHLDFHHTLAKSPEQASRDLDAALQRGFENTSRLETMVACTQHGANSIVGSQLAIPTGLSQVRTVSGSIDNGALPHNFTVSVTPSQTPGAVDIHVFQPSSPTNNTPVVATSSVMVRWVAVGGI